MSTNWPAGSARVNRRTMLSGTAALLAAPYIISSARAAVPAGDRSTIKRVFER